MTTNISNHEISKLYKLCEVVKYSPRLTNRIVEVEFPTSQMTNVKFRFVRKITIGSAITDTDKALWLQKLIYLTVNINMCQPCVNRQLCGPCGRHKVEKIVEANAT